MSPSFLQRYGKEGAIVPGYVKIIGPHPIFYKNTIMF